MTKSITIVNTSNWDGEDVELDSQAILEGTGKKILRPGESIKLNYPFAGEVSLDVRVTDKEKDKTAPIKDDTGEQVVPVVNVFMKAVK